MTRQDLSLRCKDTSCDICTIIYPAGKDDLMGLPEMEISHQVISGPGPALNEFIKKMNKIFGTSEWCKKFGLDL
jgi:hypothetical protein